MSGIRVELPDAAPGGGQEIDLPSGAEATIRQGTGRDLRMAQMSAGSPFDAAKFEYALIAQLATIGGRKVTLEAIDAMPIADVLMLQGEVNRVNFPTKGPAAE